jgi:predicted RNA-binding protein with PUA domain
MSPKIKIDKEVVEEVKEVVEEVTEAAVKPSEEKKSKKDEWPEVGSKGKFHAVAFKDGYVVYNPSGQRATGIVTKIQADDIAREQNRAAQIKIQ